MRCALALVALAACGGGETAPPADAEYDPPPAAGVDVLFVIDDSQSLDEQQLALTAAFGELVAELETLHGARPDLHVGVVSQDLGAGAEDYPGCVPGGEAGALLTGDPSCAPTDRYIVDVADGAGGRTVNYPGTLEQAFACNAHLGSGGCGFEQPLGALRLALDPATTENAGFLVDDHALAIVILMDEDDCTVTDPAVFEPVANDELGPITSFRCFEFGVVCDPDEPRAAGIKSDCVPRTDSYLADPLAIADEVRERRPRGWVSVHVVAGDLTPVEVIANPETGDPALVQSCQTDRGGADPAVRLAAFASRFAHRGDVSSICAPDFVPAMRGVAADIAEMLR